MKIIKLTQIQDPFYTYYGGLQNTYPSYQTVLGQIGSQQQQIQQVQAPSLAAAQSSGFLGGLSSLLGMGSSSGTGLAAQHHQSSIGTIATYSSPMPSAPPIMQEVTNEVFIPVSSINHFVKAQGQSRHATVLYLNNTIEKSNYLYIKESPEQILKMIHDVGFNEKMDELLK